MRNLLNFILKYNTWLIFIFYVLLSCILLFNGRHIYHQSVYLTSANSVCSSVYGLTNNITGYFNLREVNDNLQQQNAMLQNEILNLQNRLKYYATMIDTDSIQISDLQNNRFNYVIASVINNSVHRPRNYFTINKGGNDGIRPGMGVVDQNGVVGIVNVVGKNSSRIISLLNTTQHFSVKIKGTNYIGSLSWKEGNPNIAYIEEMAQHMTFHVGDTIVTSGFSTTFPEGIPVGTVLSRVKTSDDNFFTLKIKLASDFPQLGIVRVIKDNFKSELDSLQNFDAINN